MIFQGYVVKSRPEMATFIYREKITTRKSDNEPALKFSQVFYRKIKQGLKIISSFS